MISKLSRWQNFAVIRKNIDGTTSTFAECRRKFRWLIYTYKKDMFKNMRQDLANNWTLVIVLGFDLYISFSLFEYVLIDEVVR